MDIKFWEELIHKRGHTSLPRSVLLFTIQKSKIVARIPRIQAFVDCNESSKVWIQSGCR